MLVSTGDISSITTNTADASGVVIDLGAGATQHGHCYATTSNVTISDTKTELGKPPAGGFTSQLTGLVAGTKYYIKAYISDGTETVYGKEISFTTTAASLPTITTTAITAITQTTATSGGNITSDGGSPVTIRGVCWNTATGPTVVNSKTSDESGTGDYSSSLTGLAPGTTYYVRAYATNSAGTAYGNELSFVTSPVAAVVPTLTTASATAISQTTATSGGNITSSGGAIVLASGVCWSTTTNPLATGSHTTDGATTGTFASSISGLTANTSYYVRAYATNSVGTGYGNEIIFTTTSVTTVVPTLTTTAATAITQTTATSGGNITSDGGAAITANGVCWSTTVNPVATGNHTTDGATTGIFASSITGLSANTTYYVRAYATNSIGTAYGNELSFTTSPLAAVVPTLSTTTIGTITPTTAISIGNISDDGGAAVTARGICWSTATAPTIADSKTDDGTGTGTFAGNLTGLTPNTKYYVRAYATNSAGTAYGNELSFTTAYEAPGATTDAPTAVATTSVMLHATINAKDASSVVTFEYGETTSYGNTITASGSPVTGTADSSVFAVITGLTASTTYHYRVKAESAGGISYGSDVQFTTTSTVADIDGNVYNTVIIGTQLWLQENLKTTRYNDGTAIPLITDNAVWSDWSTISAFCWSNNDDVENKETYGGLYKWYTVTLGKICPVGWHVPSDDEWTTLSTYLGGESIAGGKLKETGTTHFLSPNTGATNESGFTALPGGFRSIGGSFLGITQYGSFLSSTEVDSKQAWERGRNYNSTLDKRATFQKRYGESVRCLEGADFPIIYLPPLIATEVTVITPNSATTGGTVVTDGNGTVTERGVCWSKVNAPTTADSKTSDGLGTGSFVSNITGLTANTTYYVRAYAINSAGTAYSDELSFTTNPAVLSTLTTAAISSITTTTASSGGDISDDGGASITVRGVCWNTVGSPNIGNYTTTDGSGTGSFVSNLGGLAANTTYYVRAYATNSAGTAYGNEISFTTDPINVTDIDGNSYNVIRIGTQVWLAENLRVNHYNNGELIGSTTPAILDIGAETSPKYQWSYKEALLELPLQLQPLITAGVGNFTYTQLEGLGIINAAQRAQFEIWTTKLSISYTETIQTIYNQCSNTATTISQSHGLLYTWYAITDNRKVCPAGWHVPANSEWTTLTDYLTNNGYGYEGSGSDIAKSVAATSGWLASSTPGMPGNDQISNNASGFSALPGGFRDGNGAFSNLVLWGYWWSSTEFSGTVAWHWRIYYNSAGIPKVEGDKTSGLSVRCVKDN